MRKRLIFLLSICLMLGTVTALLGGCSSGWQKKFDTTLPDLQSDKWTETLHTDFSTIDNMQELYEAGWAPSPHALRNYEYWCDQMVTFTEDGVVIKSEERENHSCPVCDEANGEPITKGVFTSGIETRPVVRDDKIGEDKNVGFTQAFGYYEATVTVPTGEGMWSAFWLQSDNCGQIGHAGKDGSEIDIYESSFKLAKHGDGTPKHLTGQAIHYDAYNAPWYRSGDNTTELEYSLYDGKPHKYALLWTPEYYVMYVDDTPVWATDCGGVSRTPEFLRLTVEIRDSGWGPYGQRIGKFSNSFGSQNDFVIHDVKVYQNSDYVEHIKAVDYYDDLEWLYTLLFTLGMLALTAIVATAIAIPTVKHIRRKKAGQHNGNNDQIS